MEFSCTKKPLVKALTDISKAIGHLIPVLEGVYIEAGEDSVAMTCYNLDFGLTATIPATVNQKGKVVVPANGLLKIAKTMTGETLTITVNAEEKPSSEGKEPITVYLIGLSDGNARFTIAGMDVEQYPEMPEIGEAKELNIPQRTLRSMLGQTLYAVAKGDARPVHTGVLFDLTDGRLNLVSVDGYRLAIRREKVESLEQLSFVVPGPCLANLVKLLNAKGESNAKILASNMYVIFEFDGYRVFSRLLDGEFLKYKESIPKSSGKYVIFPVKELSDAIGRAVQIVKQSPRTPLRVLFGSDKACLDLNTQSGIYTEEIRCESIGMDQEMLMGFNVNYLMDALKALDCDTVRVELDSALSPMKLIPVDDEEGFLHLVLPVRLRDEQAA